jgi:hypothetical protein
MTMERWDIANPERLFLSNRLRAALAASSSRCQGRGPATGGRAVKHLASPSFYRTFDLLLGLTNPGAKLSCWTHDGVEWVRERTSITGRSHGFVIEVVSLTKAGRHGWCLLVTKEHWWAGESTEAIHSGRWSRAVSGRRKDILEWFRKHESEIDRGLQVAPRRSAARMGVQAS